MERATQMLTNSSLQTSQTIICSLVLAFRTMSIDTKVCARCCQTNQPKHQYSFDEYFYEVTNERHSVRAASRLSLNVLRFESDLFELNRL